jgi:hypothetical protein
MRLKTTAAAPDPRHLRWLGKWGDSTEFFTLTCLAIRRSRARRRRGRPGLCAGGRCGATIIASARRRRRS